MNQHVGDDDDDDGKGQEDAEYWKSLIILSSTIPHNSNNTSI